MFPERQEDWDLYYQDSYLQVKLPGQAEFSWVYARRFQHVPDLGGLCVHWETHNNGAWLKIDTNEPNIDVSFPDCHYYFLDGQAMFFVKRPLRDATKTFSSENGRFVNPLIGFVPENFHMQLMREVRYPKVLSILQKKLSDFPLPNALRMLEQQKAVSVPLLKDWCVSLSLTQKGPYMLWYMLTPVAHMDGQNINVFNDPFVQEVNDVFIPLGQRVVVE